MPYAAWSVIAGEQPTAAKWNILGQNDASFNDGTGVANLSHANTAVANPYKFRAYRNAAYNTVSAVLTKVLFDAEEFDTNGNFDLTTSRYTAPLAGFYQFNGALITNHSGFIEVGLYKNGAPYSFGNREFYSPGQATRVTCHDLMQMAAGDYAEVFYYVDGVHAVSVNSTNTYFSGFLVSRT